MNKNYLPYVYSMLSCHVGLDFTRNGLWDLSFFIIRGIPAQWSYSESDQILWLNFDDADVVTYYVMIYLLIVFYGCHCPWQFGIDKATWNLPFQFMYWCSCQCSVYTMTVCSYSLVFSYLHIEIHHRWLWWSVTQSNSKAFFFVTFVTCNFIVTFPAPKLV